MARVSHGKVGTQMLHKCQGCVQSADGESRLAYTLRPTCHIVPRWVAGVPVQRPLWSTAREGVDENLMQRVDYGSTALLSDRDGSVI
jgi:hypothetical protein